VKNKKANSMATESGCPICMCPMDNVGDHRIVSLTCGHLFGENCIRKWIKSAKKCPMCNVKAIPSHLRPVYTQNVVVSEAAETKKLKQLLVNTKKKLAEEKRDRRKIAILLEIKNQECNSLKEKLQSYEKKNKALQDKISNVTAVHNIASKDQIPMNKVVPSREQQFTAKVPFQNTINKRPFLCPETRVKEIDSTKVDSQQVEPIQPPAQKKQKYVKKRIISKEMAEKIELNRQKALARRREKMNKQK
jgi:hypothetical protein